MSLTLLQTIEPKECHPLNGKCQYCGYVGPWKQTKKGTWRLAAAKNPNKVHDCLYHKLDLVDRQRAAQFVRRGAGSGPLIKLNYL